MTIEEKQLEFMIYCIESTAQGVMVRMYIIN